jgi:hypothetical protein
MSSGVDTVGTGFVLLPNLKLQLVINQEAVVLKVNILKHLNKIRTRRRSSKVIQINTRDQQL